MIDSDLDPKLERILSVFEDASHFWELLRKPDCLAKRMFGGLGIYYQGRMVAVLMQDANDWQWRGVEYDFAIWDGVLWPTDYAHHKSLMAQFPFLLHHPVLKKWVFLPRNSENYEGEMEVLLKRVLAKDPRFGVAPSPRPKKESVRKVSAKKQVKSRPRAASRRGRKSLR